MENCHCNSSVRGSGNCTRRGDPVPNENDPYVYPGTSVLKNLPGIRDAAHLDTYESDMTWSRLLELSERPIEGRFDLAHLQAVHHHIFQDVYEWAGEFRTVNISKAGSPFGPVRGLESFLSATFDNLAQENHLRGLDFERFVDRSAFYLGEINAAHPFREGNGRTQQEFLRELGLKAGFVFDWARISREEMYVACRHSLHDLDAPLRSVVQKAVATHERAPVSTPVAQDHGKELGRREQNHTRVAMDAASQHPTQSQDHLGKGRSR